MHRATARVAPTSPPLKVFGDGKFQKDEIFHPQKRGDVLKPVRQHQKNNGIKKTKSISTPKH
jgi:hypothetical protein